MKVSRIVSILCCCILLLGCQPKDECSASARVNYERYDVHEIIDLAVEVIDKGPDNIYSVYSNCGGLKRWKYSPERDITIKAKLVEKYIDDQYGEMFFDLVILKRSRPNVPIVSLDINVGDTLPLVPLNGVMFLN